VYNKDVYNKITDYNKQNKQTIEERNMKNLTNFEICATSGGVIINVTGDIFRVADIYVSKFITDIDKCTAEYSHCTEKLFQPGMMSKYDSVVAACSCTENSCITDAKLALYSKL
jgi:hypothetical protein